MSDERRVHEFAQEQHAQTFARAERAEAERDAALARADVAERECAELHDAIDEARAVLDAVQAKIRRRDQDAAWAQAAAAVAGATRP